MGEYPVKKIFRGIILPCILACVLCGCGVQPIENSATAGTEAVDVMESRLNPAPTSDTEPAPTPSPAPTPTPSPAPTPAALPASPVYLIEYGELMSSLLVLPSTEGYEKYLAEDLSYHYAYNKYTDGKEYWNFDICLPQFAKNVPCYRELNAYFNLLYEQLMHEKEDFYDWIETKKESVGADPNWYQRYSYWGMTIGEQYLTVYVINRGYFGGIRDYFYPMPVTFDMTTGEPVTLPEIWNCSEQEIKELVADYVYGYFLSQGEEYVRRDTYLCFEPQDFYMLEQGLGVYYPRYAIDCGAAGDFLFVIPYEDLMIFKTTSAE